MGAAEVKHERWAGFQDLVGGGRRRGRAGWRVRGKGGGRPWEVGARAIWRNAWLLE